MKNFKIRLCTILILASCLGLFGCSKDVSNEKPTIVDSETVENNAVASAETVENNNKFNIVCSFYPMHVLTMNLTKNIDTVAVTSMSDPSMGCIHDHTFTTDDLKKIEGADAYVENGFELETFNDKIKKAYPDVAIIEASKNISDTDLNPHLWTNIDNYISQVEYVSQQLQTLNPANKDKYAANEKEYVDKLNQLKSEYSDKLANIEGKKVLSLDETLPNFCIYTKLDYMEIETDHEQESLSASDLKDTIDKMNSENVKTILIAKDADRKNAETIAKETGATIYEMNTCMVGDVDMNAYLNDMKENFDIISTIK